MKFGDLDVEGHGQDFLCFEDDAHVDASALPRLAEAVDVPTAAHEHVGEQDEIAGEMDEEPFAAGFDFFDGAPGDTGIDFDAGEMREDGFEVGDGLTSEGAMQCSRGAEDGIAFGHVTRSPKYLDRLARSLPLLPVRESEKQTR